MTIVDQLAKNVLVLLATSVSTSAIDGAIPTKKKMRGKGVIREGKGITLVNSNEIKTWMILSEL